MRGEADFFGAGGSLKQGEVHEKAPSTRTDALCSLTRPDIDNECRKVEDGSESGEKREAKGLSGNSDVPPGEKG